MKQPTRFMMPPLLIATLCISPAVLAQTSGDLDMTMTIMEEGQQPEGLINTLQLPSAVTDSADPKVQAQTDIHTPDTEVLDQIKSEATELVEDAGNTIIDDVKDTLSIDGPATLPDDIVDNLADDLPLTDDVLDDIDTELPDTPSEDDLPLDLPDEIPDELPLDESLNDIDSTLDELESFSEEAGGNNDIDESINDVIEEESLPLEEPLNDIAPF